jgi:hypothetical protein
MRRPNAASGSGPSHGDPAGARSACRRRGAVKEADRNQAGKETNGASEQQEPQIVLSDQATKYAEHESPVYNFDVVNY